MSKHGAVCMGVLMLFFISAIALFHCGEVPSTSPTDVVTISDVNSSITEKDIASGVQKTNNFVPPVKMSHEKHEVAGVKCVQCHHKQMNDDRIKQCSPCHKGDKGRDLMHNFCVDCHVKAAKGPSQCQHCHQY